MVKNRIFKFIRLTLNYSNRNIWYLLLLALVPSVLLAFLISPYGAIDFLCNYSALKGISYAKMLLLVSGINTEYYYIGIIGVILMPFMFSILIGAVERHMRVGEFNLGFDRIRARLNYNLISSLKFFAVVLLVFTIFKLLQVTVFYLFARLLNTPWALGLSIIWYILMYFAELAIMSLGILWVPTMLQTGLNSTRALGLALRQGKEYTLGTMLTIMVPSLPLIIFMVINAELNWHADIVFDAILITMTIVIYVLYMYSMFFDINGIEREDLKKVSIWKKSR